VGAELHLYLRRCSIEIWLATLNDIEALCPLLTEFFAYNAGLQPMYCNATVERGEYPKNTIESDSADFLLAIESDAVLGFVHISQATTPPFASIVPHRYAEIMAFMITVSHRGQGIGSKLIEAAKQWGNARNLDYIEAISLVNVEANGFYDNAGFVTMSHIRRYALI